MPIHREEAIGLRATRLAEYAAKEALHKAREIRTSQLAAATERELQELGYDPALIKEILLFQLVIDASILERPHKVDAAYGDTIYAEVQQPEVSPGARAFLERAYERVGWFLLFYGDRYNPRDTRQRFTRVRGFDLAEKARFLQETEEAPI